ncbi:MAG: DNA/RNA nuclease SfsA [Gammaproteobacteria bacterium]|nr:DNA/RNA nuclease SfsA [Gammaproteobacteria bacterium]
MFIPHTAPLLEGRLLARYDRFIAAVRLGRRTVEAHCVNPGRMEGLVQPGSRAWISAAPPERKRRLRYTLELLEVDGRIVGANTQVPNQLAETLIRARELPGLKRFCELRREVPYGNGSRIDLLLSAGAGDHLVEVKNCHLVYPDDRAYFPDSVSARAAGHLRALAAEVDKGRRATVLFVLQRGDGRALRPSRLHDAAFADAALAARDAGVRFRAIKLEPTPEGFHYLGTLPVDLAAYDAARLAPFRDALTANSGWQRRGRAGRRS